LLFCCHRLDWQPDTPPDKPKETIYTNRTYKTRCIQRDRLASCLLQELKEKYSGGVSLEFGAHCVAAEWRQDKEGGAEVGGAVFCSAALMLVPLGVGRSCRVPHAIDETCMGV
jgi:hypothetical protein